MCIAEELVFDACPAESLVEVRINLFICCVSLPLLVCVQVFPHYTSALNILKIGLCSFLLTSAGLKVMGTLSGTGYI